MILNPVEKEQLERFLSAQRAFLIAIGKIFNDTVGLIPADHIFRRAFDATWMCNESIAALFGVTPETIEEINSNVQDDLIAKQESDAIGDLEKLFLES